MKVLVIGSGVIGLTTAYALNRRGHEVTVLDRQPGPALETSFANGALLTPGMSDPWNSPGCWRVLLGSLGRSDSPLLIRAVTLPSLVSWGIRFLSQSRIQSFQRNTEVNLRLSLLSLSATQALQEQTGIDFHFRRTGSLKIFRDPAPLLKASEAMERLSHSGLKVLRLTGAETIVLEPALAPIEHLLSGALYFEDDAVGDAHRFCVALADYVRRRGVTLCFGTNVKGIERASDRVSAVICDDTRFVAERYVIAAGSYSRPLLDQVGIRVPVQPAKGYSVTFPDPTGLSRLRVPVVDDLLHAVVVPLDGAVRVAGMAEFAGYDLSLDFARAQNLRGLLGAVLPEVRFNDASGTPWCGLRSASPDGVPIIGATPASNLFINTGHCHLGWTMAAGSAQLLADVIDGTAPQLDPRDYSYARFGST